TPPYVPLGAAELPNWIHVVAYVTFAVIGLRAFVRSTPFYAASRRAALTLFVLLGAPYVISFMVLIYVAGRYDVFVFRLFLLMLAAGFEGLRRPVLPLVIILGLATAALTSYYRRVPLNGTRAQASLLAQREGKHDAVVAVGFTRNPLEYYARLSHDQATFYSFPTSLGHTIGC